MKHFHLQNHLEDYRPFRFGHYLNEGFKIFSKNAGSFIAFSFLTFIIFLALEQIPFIGDFVGEILFWPSCTAGYFLVAHRIKNLEEFEFKHFFEGFHYFYQICLMALIAIGIMKIAVLPFYFAHYGLTHWSWNIGDIYQSLDFFHMIETYPNFYSWKLILLLPGLYFFITYGWACQFIIFFKMSAWEALEASRKMITARWFTFLLFYATIFAICLGGLIGLIIGIFVTMPMTICADYAAFEDLTQLSKFEQMEEYL